LSNEYNHVLFSDDSDGPVCVCHTMRKKPIEWYDRFHNHDVYNTNKFNIEHV
jgi:hypothetical protein